MEFKREYKIKAGFSSASLASVLFLLLLFMVMIGFSLSHTAINLQLPHAGMREASMLDPTTVTVSADGKYLVNDYEVSPEQIELNLLSLTEGMERPGITIKADENARHKDVVFLMEIAQRHRFNIAIATNTP